MFTLLPSSQLPPFLFFFRRQFCLLIHWGIRAICPDLSVSLSVSHRLVSSSSHLLAFHGKREQALSSIPGHRAQLLGSSMTLTDQFSPLSLILLPSSNLLFQITSYIPSHSLFPLSTPRSFLYRWFCTFSTNFFPSSYQAGLCPSLPSFQDYTVVIIGWLAISVKQFGSK